MAAVIFPNQLYEHHPALKKGRPVYLYEHPLFFKDERYPVNFHKQKLILHKASLSAYAKMLKEKGYDVKIVSDEKFLQKIDKAHICELTDYILEKRVKKWGIPIEWLQDPGFMTPKKTLQDWLGEKEHYSMASFYILQRKRLNILVSGGKPIGGKWSFDTENRKKLPSGEKIKTYPQNLSHEVKEAEKWVEKNFPGNLGSPSPFIYPVTHEEAKKWLKDFLEHRFEKFGEYQDALDYRSSYLFHSILSPLINIGLLTPEQVVSSALKHIDKVPLNSLEGFIRQVIGWREFMRGVYLIKGVDQRNANFFEHKRKLSRHFYEGTTGLAPVDTVIKRSNETAYAHHIERLMVMGNIMLLCEIDPQEVYRWFMEYFIDAYDWVMVPNVFGMSQCSDGGSIVTKPYFSGSNYLKKMGNFPHGEWEEVWDALFWRFILKHKEFFQRNPRLSVMVSNLNKKGAKEVERLCKIADRFIEKQSIA